MKAGDIQARLAATNRWWREPDSWSHDDPDLRAMTAAPFDYRPDVLRDLRPGGLYMLRGPRRVGMSTEVKATIRDLIASGVAPRRIVHASVDGWRARDLTSLVKAGNVFLSPSDRAPRFWFVDEISSVEGAWPQEIKWLRDNDPAFRTDTVVLTGSSSAHLDEAIKALAGRRGDATNTDRTLLPMSFTDVCAALGVGGWPRPPELTPPELRTPEAYEAIHAILPWMAELITTWETYLHVGGYPQAVASWITDRDVTPALIAALWDVVHGEAITARRFSGAQTSRLLSELTRNLCSPLNVADLARDLDVARATAEARIADLCRTYLVWPLHRSDGLTPSLRSQTKYYFTDPLLARLAAARGGGTSPSLPQLNQQQVGLALQRHIDRQMPGTFARCDEILYYRSKTGTEIDFVGRRLQPVVVESKYVDDKWGRELQTIQASGWHGVIASRSGVDVGPTATVMPSPVLAILLGS